MADIKSAEERSRNMAAIHNRDTQPELFIRKALYRDGFRYRIAPEYIPGHPDLYLAKYNLAIFIHGCFWHRHRGCKYAYTPKTRTEFWQKKFSDNQRRDHEVSVLLEEKGIRELIIWECAIREILKKDADKQAFIDRIESMIISDQSYGEEGAT